MKSIKRLTSKQSANISTESIDSIVDWSIEFCNQNGLVDDVKPIKFYTEAILKYPTSTSTSQRLILPANERTSNSTSNRLFTGNDFTCCLFD
jgi:hypothetical protein